MVDWNFIIVFCVAGLTTYLIMAPSSQERLVRQRARVLRRSRLVRRKDGSLMDEELALPFSQRVLRPLLERFSRWVVHLTPSKAQEAKRLKLARAGNPLRPGAYMGLQVLSAVGLGAVGFLLGTPFLREKPAMGLLLTLVLTVLGWVVPDFWLSRMSTTRLKEIERALPDVLDLLSVSVEAGLGLDGAIQKVGEKFPEPTAGEFRELLKAIRLGTPRADALRALADRTGLADIRTFTAAIIQAEQLGVPISRVLRTQSESLRVRRKQRVEEKAMALTLKLLFPLLFFIFPTIFIVVLGPVLISFIENFAKM